LCAFGSCATTGGIPGLANLGSAAEILDYVYEDSPSSTNPDHARPQPECEVPSGRCACLISGETVRTLDQVVEVDYLVPGCPPQPERIAEVVDQVVDILSNGKPLPPRGAVLGAEARACCEECDRKKDVKKIKHFVRPHEVVLDRKSACSSKG